MVARKASGPAQFLTSLLHEEVMDTHAHVRSASHAARYSEDHTKTHQDGKSMCDIRQDERVVR